MYNRKKFSKNSDHVPETGRSLSKSATGCIQTEVLFKVNWMTAQGHRESRPLNKWSYLENGAR